MQRPIFHRALTLLTALAPLILAGAAGHKMEGTVTLSSGEKIPGRVSLTRGKPLLVRVPGQEAPLRIWLSEAARIDVVVAKKRIEPEWRFKEEGSNEKVYTGRTRPRLEFGLNILQRNGKTVEGEIAKGTTVFVETAEGKRRKRWLQPYVHGEYGQTARDVVYVKSIVLGKAETQAPKPPADAVEPQPPTPPE